METGVSMHQTKPVFQRLFVLNILFLLMFSAMNLSAQNNTVLSGTWGSEPDQLGLNFQTPGMLPAARLMSPGGFAVARDGTIWITDSVQGKVKRFSRGKVEAVAIPGKGLTDISIGHGMVAVCQANPPEIIVINPEKMAIEKRIPVPGRTPARLLMLTPEEFVVSASDGTVSIILGENLVNHPAQALEPVGDRNLIFGTQYGLAQDSRSIIQVNPIALEAVEPELFAVYTVPERKIVFSRLIGTDKGKPVMCLVFADDPSRYEVIRFDEKGVPELKTFLEIFDTPYLASPWIIGEDGSFYGFKADLHGFSIVRRDWLEEE